ncbi:MAG: hypothetical protein AB7P42_09505 [Gammaproteobacteria bacterium]
MSNVVGTRDRILIDGLRQGKGMQAAIEVGVHARNVKAAPDMVATADTAGLGSIGALFIGVDPEAARLLPLTIVNNSLPGVTHVFDPAHPGCL